MKRYFIPNREGVSWAIDFVKDLEKQGWKAEIVDTVHDGFHIKRSDRRAPTWYVRKNWGKVEDEFKIDDGLFEL